MILVFYGDDRVQISTEVERLFEGEYEIVDGEMLTAAEMVNVFYGTSLFSNERKILVKDLGESDGWNELVKYLDTPHEVVIWESKLDKRSVVYKELIAQKVELREFKLVESPDKKLVFDVFDTALKDGRRAVDMVEKIEVTNDPYMFFGLLVSQAIKRFETRKGDRERRILKEMTKVDMSMKTTAIEPWLLIKGFLVSLSRI
jgi:hypothetical protein